jgi:hypothetical protein
MRGHRDGVCAMPLTSWPGATVARRALVRAGLVLQPHGYQGFLVTAVVLDPHGLATPDCPYHPVESLDRHAAPLAPPRKATQQHDSAAAGVDVLARLEGEVVEHPEEVSEPFPDAVMPAIDPSVRDVEVMNLDLRV